MRVFAPNSSLYYAAVRDTYVLGLLPWRQQPVLPGEADVAAVKLIGIFSPGIFLFSLWDPDI